MTRLKLNGKPTILSRNTSILALCFFLLQGITSFAGIVFAKDTATNIDELCNRQSMLMIAELSHDAENELTDQDVNIMRASAMKTCKEIYHKMKQSHAATPDDDTAISKPLNIKTATPNNSEDIQEDIQEDINIDKKSIFSRLFSTTEKKDLNPMQKHHRTGGK